MGEKRVVRRLTVVEMNQRLKRGNGWMRRRTTKIEFALNSIGRFSITKKLD